MAEDSRKDFTEDKEVKSMVVCTLVILACDLLGSMEKCDFTIIKRCLNIVFEHLRLFDRVVVVNTVDAMGIFMFFANTSIDDRVRVAGFA